MTLFFFAALPALLTGVAKALPVILPAVQQIFPKAAAPIGQIGQQLGFAGAAPMAGAPRQRAPGAGAPFRRINVLNPRALSRALRRAKGFTKYAQRVGTYTMPGRRYNLRVRRKRR